MAAPGILEISFGLPCRYLGFETHMLVGSPASTGMARTRTGVLLCGGGVDVVKVDLRTGGTLIAVDVGGL